MYEVIQNPHPYKRDYVLGIVQRCLSEVRVTAGLESRALELERRGFKAIDSLHLACAEAASVDFFCSCDDRLLNKAKLQSDLKVKTVSPLELVEVLKL